MKVISVYNIIVKLFCVRSTASNVVAIFLIHTSDLWVRIVKKKCEYIIIA